MAEAVGSASSIQCGRPKKNAAASRGVFYSTYRNDYFDTAFLKARSIFSLVASQQDWLA
jgi:hypothetical protein